MDDSATEGAVERAPTRLWERHFRDPEVACAEARALLAETPHAPSVARGWCVLTIAFHHLFFTSSPRDARDFLAQAREAFAAIADRRGELLTEVGTARLAILEGAPAAACERLLSVARRCEGLANKELAKFTSQIEAICDKLQ
jgi:hypothetical protein